MHNDNGSNLGGFMAAILCLFCLWLGYTIRDGGYVVQLRRSEAVVRN